MFINISEHTLCDCLLQALVPITEDVEVSYELHRYIIGQKGIGIRKMMEDYEVRRHATALWCHLLGLSIPVLSKHVNFGVLCT